jgi:signal transduction histidine kinase
MSLRKRIVFILSIVIIIYIGFDYAIQRMIVFPSFVSLEKNEAKKDIVRCVEALKREIHHLDAFVFDWAAWDDTYEFIVNKNKEYIESNVTDTLFIDLPLNLIYYLNAKGGVVFGKVFDLEKEEYVLLKEFPPVGETFPEKHRLFPFDIEKKNLAEISMSGIFMTEKGPMIIASRPILTSNNEGPIRGAIIMGKFLGEDAIEKLKIQIQVDFRLWSIPGGEVPENDKIFLGRLSPSDPPLIHESGNNLLRVYTDFRDIKGEPALLIRADIPRDITAKGFTAMRFAVISIVVVGLVVLLVLLLLLQRTVTRPISKLTKHTKVLGKKGNLSKRILMQRNDEIGTLAASFDEMTDELEKTIISRDQEITERKQAQEALKKTHDELEIKVQGRTADLAKTNKELQNLSAHLQSIREDERTHVAREIHDELGQLLTTAKIELSDLTTELPQDKNSLIEKNETILKIIDTGIQVVRKISSDLRPGILDILGVIPAMESHAEKFQAHTGITCEVISDTDEIVLDKKSSTAVFRIFQESLTNVARHANATKVTTDLKNENNSLILKICDNGRGIAKEEVASTESFGLIGIKERAHSVGGKVKIDGVEGKGTTITLRIPLAK